MHDTGNVGYLFLLVCVAAGLPPHAAFLAFPTVRTCKHERTEASDVPTGMCPFIYPLIVSWCNHIMSYHGAILVACVDRAPYDGAGTLW